MSGPAQPEPGVSVVVAAHTLDRWDDIVAGLRALAHQTVPPVETILVVDHNPQLLVRAREAFPDVAVLDNPRTAGASGARNTGIAHARGSVIAFVDDDQDGEIDSAYVHETGTDEWTEIDPDSVETPDTSAL